MLQIGSYVDGKYKVLNKIGQGGMSVVYLALNEKANKTWAIKEVRKDGQQDFTTVKQGLIAETNILKELNHKYLPSIIDVIDDGDSFLIVMDYIQGKSLDITATTTKSGCRAMHCSAEVLTGTPYSRCIFSAFSSVRQSMAHSSNRSGSACAMRQ